MNSDKLSQTFDPSMATTYRAIGPRLSYLGWDRREMQFAVKELRREMSNPAQGSWTKMKRLLRYLEEVPGAVLRLGYQKAPE